MHLCFPRCKANTHFVEKFPVIRPFVDKVLLQEWRLVSKRACPVEWVSSRVAVLKLLFAETSLVGLVNAGEEWRTVGSEHLIKILDEGGDLASSLFGGCVGDVIEGRLMACIDKEVHNELTTLKPAFGMDVTLANIETIQCKITKKAMTIEGALEIQHHSF